MEFHRLHKVISLLLDLDSLQTLHKVKFTISTAAKKKKEKQKLVTILC